MLRAGSRWCGVLLAAVVVAGCSGGAQPPVGAPVSTTAAPVPDPSVVAVPAGLPMSAAPDLLAVPGSSGDPRDARFTTTYDVPGVPGYRDVAAGVVAGVVAGYTARLQAIADEKARNGRLTVTTDLVAAGGRAVGLRIATISAVQQGTDPTRTAATAHAVRPDGEGTGEGTGEVVTSPELLTDDGRTALTAAVTDTLQGGAAPGPALLDDLRVQGDGSLVAVVPPAAPAAGETAVLVPAARAADWLSPAGRRVVDELASATPSSGAPAATGAVDCAVQSCIALTFDDGPGPYTARLLDELAAAGVHATFFVVGHNVAARPQLVARAAAEGHEIGNHSWDHPQLTTLSAAQVDTELDRTSDAVAAATGGAPPTIVRPPYGDYDDAVLGELAARGESAVTWDVDTLDWQNRDAGITTTRALAGAVPGSIVLMHDIHPSSVDALPGLVAQLQQRGFTFVTVSQLLGTDLVPGAAYARGPERP
ncbi:Peptidoglycan/xylan/chitin deacetylase, PgdA/CDA1 family [Klenkia soli]|uniref:Peptidoglycan/xylan/chitin deacetylase, PgdA/CDA1 family n=1 Tax=Klenkia soli TaxID=1052260 RepID=A0A1H0CFZ0_9ACTN|nr:polysaccharide deacetylase family protein [Klenkia soli]SDN56711.1 Peptidoglycan/xylan/chitin deacetylase, PgdA/CDA1 family [Klenkia soli]